jgi:hypothetical protein
VTSFEHRELFYSRQDFLGGDCGGSEPAEWRASASGEEGETRASVLPECKFDGQVYSADEIADLEAKGRIIIYF